MNKEEIKSFIRDQIKEQFRGIQEKLATIDQEILRLKIKNSSNEKDYKSLKENFQELELGLQTTLNELQEAKLAAHQILELEEQTKQNQENNLNLQNLSNDTEGPLQEISQSEIAMNEQVQKLPQQFSPDLSQITQRNDFGNILYTTYLRKKYHKGDCEYVKNLDYPITREQARKESLSACQVCNP